MVCIADNACTRCWLAVVSPPLEERALDLAPDPDPDLERTLDFEPWAFVAPKARAAACFADADTDVDRIDRIAGGVGAGAPTAPTAAEAAAEGGGSPAEDDESMSDES